MMRPRPVVLIAVLALILPLVGATQRGPAVSPRPTTVRMVTGQADALTGQKRRPTYSARVDLATVPVIVLDQAGLPVDQVQAEEFLVRQDGVELPATMAFELHEMPLDLAVVVDRSGSMGHRDGRSRAHALLEVLEPVDRVVLITFNQDVDEPRWGPADDPDLHELLQRTRAEGATALYDAIVVAVEELGPARTGRRRAIIVISDGSDSSSSHSANDAMVAAQQAGVPIFPLLTSPTRFGPPLPPTSIAGRQRGGPMSSTSSRLLAGVAIFSGGASLPLDSRYQQALRWLRGTYVVGFPLKTATAVESEPMADTAHDIRLRVDRPGVRVLYARQIYR